jgi:hypothetical protein
MVAQCVYGYASNFCIFTGHVVLRDECLHFITHRSVDSHLSSDGSATCSFSAAASFKQGASITSGNSAHLCRSLACGELPTEPSFSCSDFSGLFTSDVRSLTTKLASREATSATAARTSSDLAATTTT